MDPYVVTLHVELECSEDSSGLLICRGELPRLIKHGRKMLFVVNEPEVEYREIDREVAKYIEKLEIENMELKREIEELKRKLEEKTQT